MGYTKASEILTANVADGLEMNSLGRDIHLSTSSGDAKEAYPRCVGSLKRGMRTKSPACSLTIPSMRSAASLEDLSNSGSNLTKISRSKPAFSQNQRAVEGTILAASIAIWSQF